jgi:peptide/nickel transport system substrate-binding protein
MDRINYWTRRATRRRFLGSSGALGAGAAGLALVGCGDDDSGGADTGRAGLATPTAGANATPTPVDPFANAKKGGTYKITSTGDAPTIDPYGNLSFLTKGTAAYIYSRLYRYKAGPGIKPADVRPIPDLAQSAETSPDGMKWTIKLRPGVKFHNIPPVNGRVVTADDMKYSWGRATEDKNTNRTQLSFVDKVEYPDATTVVFTLKAPNVVFLDVLADANLLWIMPAEADGKFDPNKIMIGTGPWVWDSYQPSVSFKVKKNADWFEKGFPLMDAVEVAIIPEYATRLAQFLAGNTDAEGINAADLVDTKKQIKDIQLFGTVAQQNNYIFFDPDPGSPWAKDDRVRLAVSMAQDRDAITDLVYDNKKLKAAGIDVQGPWNNLIPAGMTRFWLDPQGKDHGDSAKYFKYDVAEAKKLLSAAGFPNGFETIYQYTANRYGKGFNDAAEASQSFLTAIGIKTTTDVQDYSSKYITQTFTGNFKGIAFGLETPFPEGGSYPTRLFTDNPNNRGRIKDATLLKLTNDQQLEANEEKRKQIFWEMQRYHATKMYYIPSQVGAGTGWAGYQPGMRNAVEFQTTGYGGPTETYPFRWKNA